MAYVNFNRTKPASFALSEYADKNTIYFTTDTHEIIINGEAFGTDDLSELQKQIGIHAEEIKTLTTDLSNLEATHEEEAEVIAAALNDLNKRLSEGINELTPLVEQNTSDLNNLTPLVNQNSENIASLESAIIENELTTSAALNDLNSKLLDTIDTAAIDAMFL